MNVPVKPKKSIMSMPVPKRAYGRTLADFDPLLPAEQILLEKCAKGEKASIGNVVPSDDSSNNKIVRASLLRFLLLGGDEQAPVHEQGVQLFGALVQGQLNLENCRVPHGITLENCKFDEPIIARDAHIAGLFLLSGSHLLQGLQADRLSCDSGVFLLDGFRAFAEVRMCGAKIGGSLECTDGQFEPIKGRAFSADRAVIKDSVFFNKSFKASGEVRLLGAQIGGNLVCSGGIFEPKQGPGLHADDAVVKGNVFLNEKFKATGVVRLLGAQIGGDLDCSGGQFEPKKGYALSADRLFVKGGVFLNMQFKATGAVQLLGAQIGGDLVCSGSMFQPKDGPGISGDGVVVKGNVFLDEKFKSTGIIRLVGAQIGGDLDCSGGKFEPKEGGALSADRAFIKGGVFLNEQFKATGTVRLSGAQIGGTLNCSAGQFEPKEGHALNASRIVVKGAVLLNKQFKATGAVFLIGAQIGGDLSCLGGQFSVHSDDVLHLQTVSIQGGLILRDMLVPVRIIATSAQIGMLVDAPAAWAKGSILNGLVYGSLAGTALTDAVHRIAWLEQQRDKDLGEDKDKKGFRPQPWKQLQKVLREMGHEADAREVGIAFEDQLRKADRIGQITDASKAKNKLLVVRRQCLRGLHWLFGALAGYGYRPLRLFSSMVVVWLCCALAYWLLALPPNNAIGPTDPLVFQHPNYAECTAVKKGNWMLCDPLPAEYTTFSPIAYSLDILLPLVDLGQEKSWGPLVPTPKQPLFDEIFSFSAAHFVRLLNWIEILYGWIASLLFVAIVSGMSRRSEMEK